MNFIKWSICKKQFLRKVDFDSERFESIIELAKDRLELVKSLKSNSKNTSFIVENYYEVIKELLVAYLFKEGMRSKNHQCLISYFHKENLDLENECSLIAQMSFFRNRLNYYGDKIPKEFYIDKKDDFVKIIKIILDKLEKQ